MQCPSCGKNNADERRLCANCGAALPRACPKCGFLNQPSVRFCGSCGISLEAAASTSPSNLPESFAGGRYRVIRLLGEGGSKVVYLARDVNLDREVAFALIRIGADPGARQRVAREARAMGRLGDHPNIVTVYDVGEENGQPYIVSQFMPGGSVDEMIDRSEGRRLRIADALAIAIDVCTALEHAHALGIVHRDVKPANVWLGKDGHCKLGDFGLAVARDFTRLTASGVMVGTVAYIAPEQVQGKTPIPRSDLYALGAMLYEMLAGHPPFQGPDLVSIISQHLEKRPAPPSNERPEVPNALDALVLEMLAKRPEDRPPDAATVHSRLKSMAENLSSAIDKLAKSVAVERPNLSIHAASDGTVSIMFSDIENSTALYDRLGDARAQEIIRTHNSIVRAQISAHRGREVKAMGDGFMVVFQSARRALQCAVAVQHAFAAYTKEHPQFPLRVRIGLHLGEAIKESDDFFGSAVIMAARIGAQAEGGEILVSSVFKEVIGDTGEVRFDAGRDLALKGFSGPRRVHRALWAKPATARTQACPSCRREIPTGAIDCPYCTVPETDEARFEFGKPDAIVLTKELMKSSIPRRIAIGVGVIAAVVALTIGIGRYRGEQHPRRIENTAAPSTAQPSAPPLPMSVKPANESPPDQTVRRHHHRFFGSRENSAEGGASPAPSVASDDRAARRGKYNIVVNDTMGRADADEMADRLRRLGYNAYLVPTAKDGEETWMVKVGPYATAAEASSAQQQLNQKYRSTYPPQ